MVLCGFRLRKMMAAGRGPALGGALDSLLQPPPFAGYHCTLSSGLHICAPAVSSSHFFLLDKLCLSVPSPSSVAHLPRTTNTPQSRVRSCSSPALPPSPAYLPTSWRSLRGLLISPGQHLSGLGDRSPDTRGQGGRRNKQLTHCRWRSRSLALSPGTGTGRPALPGPGRAAARGAGLGSAPVHPAAASADPAWHPGAASALPLSGEAEDRVVTKVRFQGGPPSALSHQCSGSG